MNTASLELCKELYELSGWEPEYWKRNVVGVHDYLYAKMKVENSDPAYDLGYLLRKLPKRFANKDGHYLAGYSYLSLRRIPTTLTVEQSWKAMFGKKYEATADTPEDAACKLAIELIKQKVITP